MNKGQGQGDCVCLGSHLPFGTIGLRLSWGKNITTTKNPNNNTKSKHGVHNIQNCNRQVVLEQDSPLRQGLYCPTGELARVFEDARATVAIDITLGTNDLPKSALKTQCSHRKARNQGTKQGGEKAKTQMGAQREGV